MVEGKDERNCKTLKKEVAERARKKEKKEDRLKLSIVL